RPRRSPPGRLSSSCLRTRRRMRRGGTARRRASATGVWTVRSRATQRAAPVDSGDLTGEITAYREADRRAPAEDKAEIAGRLGWLNKETGNTRASQRYFSRSRGDARRVTATLVVIAVTSIISLTALLSEQATSKAIYDLLQLDK